MACTVCATPQMRCVKIRASRGSRPCRISSIPRHICPEDQALTTLPLSTSQSMRRWPSIRVIGSTVIRVVTVYLQLLNRGHAFTAWQHRQLLDEQQIEQDLDREHAYGDQNLCDRRKVVPAAAGRGVAP